MSWRRRLQEDMVDGRSVGDDGDVDSACRCSESRAAATWARADRSR